MHRTTEQDKPECLHEASGLSFQKTLAVPELFHGFSASLMQSGRG